MEEKPSSLFRIKWWLIHASVLHYFCRFISLLIGRETINIPEVFSCVHGFTGKTVNSNFPRSIPCLFIWELPPPPVFLMSNGKWRSGVKSAHHYNLENNKYFPRYKGKETPWDCAAKWQGWVVSLLIYRRPEQDGRGRELKDTGKGSERAGYEKWEVLAPFSTPKRRCTKFMGWGCSIEG